jgi:hypothetical protein
MTACTACKCDIECYGIKVKHYTFCDANCLMVYLPDVDSIQKIFKLEGFQWFIPNNIEYN